MKKLLKVCLLGIVVLSLVACGSKEKDMDEIRELLDENDFNLIYTMDRTTGIYSDEDGLCFDFRGRKKDCERDQGEYDEREIYLMSDKLVIEYIKPSTNKGFIMFKEKKDAKDEYGEYIYFIDMSEESEGAYTTDICSYYFKGKPTDPSDQEGCEKYKDKAEKIQDNLIEDLDEMGLTFDDVQRYLMNYDENQLSELKKDMKKEYKEKGYSADDFYKMITRNYFVEAVEGGYVIGGSSTSQKKEEAIAVSLKDGKPIFYHYLNEDEVDEIIMQYNMDTKELDGLFYDNTCKYNIVTKKSEKGYKCSESQIERIQDLNVGRLIMIDNMGLSETEFLNFLKEFKIK